MTKTRFPLIYLEETELCITINDAAGVISSNRKIALEWAFRTTYHSVAFILTYSTNEL